LDLTTLVLLNEVFKRLGADVSVRAIVLIGENGSFSTGDDLKESARIPKSEFAEIISLFQDVTRNLWAMPQPVVAAIGGYAFGGGLEIAAACDLRIASEDARFSLPEVNHGLVITNGSSSLLGRIVGEGRAREMVLTGDVFDAAWARESGLVNRVVPAARLTEAALALAERLASRPAGAMRSNKALLNLGFREELAGALDAEQRAIVEAFASEDAQRALKAFLERKSSQAGGAA
jgi:enoyl-CoA hydratase/carnithine racemase